MKKISILPIIILLLCGCNKNPTVNSKNSFLETYCDEKYGVEYIRNKGPNLGGITVRLDENGNVIHCEVERK